MEDPDTFSHQRQSIIHVLCRFDFISLSLQMYISIGPSLDWKVPEERVVSSQDGHQRLEILGADSSRTWP